jgi:hypothetical protein
MPSPQEYYQKITKLGLDNWALSVSSVTEAKKALREVNDHPQRGWLELMHLEGALLLT